MLLVGVSGKDALYAFYGKIISCTDNPVPMLRIVKLSYSCRIQRRKYARVKGEVEIKMRPHPKQSSKMILPLLELSQGNFRQKDIGGGGILMSSPKTVPRGAFLEVQINLPTGKIQILAEVVRVVKEETGNFNFAVSFKEIQEKDRDQLVKYIYSRQIELRRKGVE